MDIAPFAITGILITFVAYSQPRFLAVFFEGLSMEWLGPWRLDAARFALVSSQELRELEPLLFKLAVYFFANPERIIARQELAEQVWQQAYVDDNAINRAISDLRKALQHPQLTDSVLKTHHRKGYSLLWNFELQQQFSAELSAVQTAEPSTADAQSAEPLAQPHAALTTTTPDTAFADNAVSAEISPQDEPLHKAEPVPQSKRKWHWPLVVAAILILGLAGYWYMRAQLSTPIHETEQEITTSAAAENRALSVQLLTSEEGIALTPLISPDRTLLAYSQTASEHLSQIRVQRYQEQFAATKASAADAVSLELAGHHLYGQNWQHGKPVLLVQATERKSGNCSYRLYDFSAYPAYQQRALDVPCSSHSKMRAILSADGQLLFRAERAKGGKTEDLLQHELATGQQQVLVNNRGSSFGLMDFTLSPNGEQLAYIRLDSNKAGFIYLYDLQKQEQRQLTDFSLTGPVLQLAFNPAGTHLYALNGLELVQVRLSDRRVQKQPLPAGFTGGEISLLNDNTAIVSELSTQLSSRNSSMAVAELTDIFDPKKRKARWFWQGKGSIAAVTPDPTNPERFAFMHTDGQGWQLWLREGDQDRQLTEMPRNNQPVNHLSWSPDGQQLVFSRNKVLWRYQFQSQQLSQIHPLAEFSFPVFDPSGQSLVVQRDVGSEQQIWRLQLASGQLLRLGLNQGWVPQFSDGELYYYRGFQLMRYVDGGKGDQLITANNEQLVPTYRVSQGWVYYYAHHQKEFRRFPLIAPTNVEKVSLQQLQLGNKSVPISFTLQAPVPDQLFVNMMMFQQLRLYQLQWPAFSE
jgi:DNA-binding winged helix-turn-helix (wHTH) protein/Tol biopolymer transport system component